MKCFWLFLLVGFSTLPVRAQAPLVRAQLHPSRGILVGQPVRLNVTILVPNYFTGSPKFPEFEIENAIVVLPQDRPQNLNEQIDGITYAGISEVYTIYPQQAGDFKIPLAEVHVSYAVDPPRTTTAQVPLSSLEFHADVPAAAANLDYFLPTTRMTIRQSWSPPLKNLRAGDAVERTITVTAAKMQAMLIPPLAFTAPDGIRAYEEEPIIQDQKTDRGDFLYGRRTQSVKYLIKKEGSYTLPAIDLKWWNLSTNRLVTASLPAVQFSAATANAVSELPPEQKSAVAALPEDSSFWRRHKLSVLSSGLCLIALLVFLWMAGKYVRLVYRRLRSRYGLYVRSEVACFRRLERACQRNDATATYGLLLRWLETARPNGLEEFVRLTADRDLTFEVAELGVRLFGKGNQGSAGWDGKRLAKLLKRYRKQQRKHSALQVLPRSLNP